MRGAGEGAVDRRVGARGSRETKGQRGAEAVLLEETLAGVIGVYWHTRSDAAVKRAHGIGCFPNVGPRVSVSHIRVRRGRW